jgi:hypothetical protein
MNSCPLCQREYSSDINFCLDDGQTLVRHPERVSEPTIFDPVRQTANIPFEPSYAPPVPWAPQTAFHQFAHPPSKTLATISLSLSLISITAGWCCFVGLILSPAAIITGGVALSKISTNPNAYAGRYAAIAGIAIAVINLLLYLMVFAMIR